MTILLVDLGAEYSLNKLDNENVLHLLCDMISMIFEESK